MIGLGIGPTFRAPLGGTSKLAQPVVIKDSNNNVLKDENGNVLTTGKTKSVLPIT